MNLKGWRRVVCALAVSLAFAVLAYTIATVGNPFY